MRHGLLTANAISTPLLLLQLRVGPFLTRLNVTFMP